MVESSYSRELMFSDTIGSTDSSFPVLFKLINHYVLVQVKGLEPPCREAHEPESCVSANSTTSAKVLWISGGADRDRTDDLHNAIVALYQLSYNPIKHF